MKQLQFMKRLLAAASSAALLLGMTGAYTGAPALSDFPALRTEAAVTAATGVTFAELQERYPAGRYWNHMGMTKNNADGTTDTPCNHNLYGMDYCNDSSGYGAYQCFGYAGQLGQLLYHGDWFEYWKHDRNLDTLKAGDVIMYRYNGNKYNGHTIMVTAVQDNTVYITDCNSDGHCRIRWNAAVDKSVFLNGFNSTSYNGVYHSPALPAMDDPKLTVYFNANGGSIPDGGYTVRLDGTICTAAEKEPVSEEWVIGDIQYMGLPGDMELNLTKPGFSFEGWSASPDSEMIIPPNLPTSSLEIAPNAIDADSEVTLYARWTPSSTVYVSDIMIAGISRDADGMDPDETAADFLREQGFTVISYDLNKSCGNSSDCIYLGVRMTDDPSKAVTDILISDRAVTSEADSFVQDGMTYRLCPFTGGTQFTKLYGDLNSAADGRTLHIYYSKDPNAAAVTGIAFDDIAEQAVSGMDLNSGALQPTGAPAEQIYMHLTVQDLTGDVNLDGAVDAADAMLLQKWLLGIPETELPCWRAGDTDGSGSLTAADLTLLKAQILLAAQ